MHGLNIIRLRGKFIQLESKSYFLTSFDRPPAGRLRALALTLNALSIILQLGFGGAFPVS